MQCSQCGKHFDAEGSPVASISGGIMGDEYTDSYYFCSECGVYTVEAYRDRFLGEAEVSTRGPVPRGEGEAKVRLIKQCDQPWDKNCRCAAHLAYFDGWLD